MIHSETVPWSFQSEDGNWRGYNIDLIDSLLSTAGIKPLYIDLPYFDIQPIHSKNVDKLLAGRISGMLEPDEMKSGDFK